MYSDKISMLDLPPNFHTLIVGLKTQFKDLEYHIYERISEN